MIIVKRHSDGKIFTSDISAEKEFIYEVHFSTTCTQVRVQECDEMGNVKSFDIICKPTGCRQGSSDLVSYTGTLGWASLAQD